MAEVGKFGRARNGPSRGKRPRRKRRPAALYVAPWGVVVSALAMVGVPSLKLPFVTSSEQVSVSFSACGHGNDWNCVVDGDTIRLGGEKIRVSDFNTPEIGKPDCERERQLGLRAKSRLIELLNRGPFDVSTTIGRDRDVYGRKLRLISRDGTSLGDTLIAEGLAHRWLGYKQNWCV